MRIRKRIVLHFGKTDVDVQFEEWEVQDGHETAALTYARRNHGKEVTVTVRRMRPLKPKVLKAQLHVDVLDYEDPFDDGLPALFRKLGNVAGAGDDLLSEN